MRQRHPVRVADGGVASRERDRGEMSDAIEPGVVGDEHLASPHRAVGAVPGAVEAEADDGLGHAVLGHHRGDVGMVMLHSHDPATGGVAHRPSRREVPRVEVRRQDVRFDPEELLHVLDGVRKCVQGLEVLHVADVLAHERVPSVGETEGRLELAAGRQQGRHLEGKLDGEWGVAAGSPHREHPAGDYPHNRVVDGNVDVAVMHQEGIREVGETLASPGVVVDDRFLGAVA